MEVKRFEKTGENIGRLWRKLWENKYRFAAGDGSSLEEFLSWATAESTRIYDIENGKGAVWVTNIGPFNPTVEWSEIVGNPHAFFWDRTLLGRWEEFREAALWIMRDAGIDRAIGQSPQQGKLARRFIERLGFKRIGTMRQANWFSNGVVQDVILYECLLSDLEGKEE